MLATILASGVAQLDATVVNVALPRIGKNLHVGLTSLQWTVNAYTLTLSGLLLLGGSLGDRLGRRRIFVLGVIWFTAASVGCALAPSAGVSDCDAGRAGRRRRDAHARVAGDPAGSVRAGRPRARRRRVVGSDRVGLGCWPGRRRVAGRCGAVGAGGWSS